MNRWRLIIRSALQHLGLLVVTRRWLGRKPDGSQLNTNASGQQSSVNTIVKAQSDLKDVAYEQRLAAERATFTNNINVHDLPQIFHYWSGKYLLPSHQPFGFTCPDSFYCLYLESQMTKDASRTARFASIGAGNCDTEVQLAVMLRQRGYTNFSIECIDINVDMLSRGKVLASSANVTDNIIFSNADFNLWRPAHSYDAVIANQSLHHVEKLESLFTSIKDAIGESGIFLTSDMIGRNGHMLWPEAQSIVQQYWQELPPSYRYNQQLCRHEEEYENWDCSQFGFEGIRAQDILPLLVKEFHFQAFFAFSNLVDPFIGRAFGHNFDVKNDRDRDFIDRIHMRDQAELLAGRIKPTHMIAAMRGKKVSLQKYIPPFTPEFSIRLNAN